MERNETAALIRVGEAVFGLELGSTRIKAVLIGPEHAVLASGAHDWENRLEQGVWTYHMDDVWHGIQESYKNLAASVEEKYGEKITHLKALGFSAMMHGYLAFDREGELLVPFRTWRNTMTEEAAADLTSRFGFNIPQRWSIAHLHQAILNNEPHVKDIAFITTLAGYVHWKLTGEKVLGIGDASGMFPIDSEHNVYDSGMMDTFDILHKEHNLPWRLRDILPQIDLVLIMSVEPGFGGQAFIPASLEKIAQLRALADELGTETIIEVDGGISSHNAHEVFGAGADVLVAGNAVFGAEDPQAEIVKMLNA